MKSDSILWLSKTTDELRTERDLALEYLHKADAVLEFAPETIDYILEGFDGHEFDKAAAGRGMEMGCIACCQMQALYELRAALAEWAEVAAPEEAQK